MKTVKTNNPSDTHVNSFESAITSMVATMGRMYKNQTLKELDQKTVKKFEDAQVGNFGKVWLSLASRVERKLRSRFDDKRIESMAKEILSKQDNLSRNQFYKALGDKVGFDTKQMLATEGLTPNKNALILETSQWVKRLRDETLENWTASTLREMAVGKGIGEIMQGFDGMVEERKNHSKFIARTQIAMFNSAMTKMRAQKLGIEKAKWVTAGDERVRKCHEVRDGKEFELSEGLYSSCDGKTLLPGQDFSCRCTYELLLTEE